MPARKAELKWRFVSDSTDQQPEQWTSGRAFRFGLAAVVVIETSPPYYVTDTSVFDPRYAPPIRWKNYHVNAVIPNPSF